MRVLGRVNSAGRESGDWCAWSAQASALKSPIALIRATVPEIHRARAWERER